MKKVLIISIAMIIAAAATAPALEGGGDVAVFDAGSKAPYPGFLFDTTPKIVRVDMTPEQPVAGESVKVGALVVQDRMRASLPVRKVGLYYRAGDGEWTGFEMLKSDGDPDYYFAYLPKQPAGTKVEFIIRAEDFAGGVTTELPKGGEMFGVRDADEEDETVNPDIDVLALDAGYDDDYLYVKLTVDGTPGKGDMVKQGAYIYFMPVIDVASGMGAADLFSVPLLAYAPIMSSYLAVPAAGLYRLSEILTTKKQMEGADVKVKKDEHSLSFRVGRGPLSASPEGPIGIAALTMSPKNFESMMPWEASPYLTMHFRSHKYEVAAKPPAVKFRAGAAQEDITPPIGTPLCGYGDRKGAPSTGVHDPLMVQALVLEAGGTKYAVVTADFMYIRRKLYNDLGRAMEEKLGIPRSNLLLSGSHSHSSSGGMFPELAILGGAVSPGLYEATLAKFIKAVEEADAALRPARIGTGTGVAEGMNNNRTEEGGPVDQTLSVMNVQGEDGKPIAVYYNFSAHPTVMGGGNREFTAEYPGAVRKHMGEKYPGGIFMFANGSLGNMSPGCPGDCGGGFDKIDRMGEIFTGLISDIISKMQMKGEAEFSFISKEVLMHPGYDLWTNMSGMRIGDAALISEPGEIYVEIGFPVREKAKALGVKTCFILGITNDGIGYIIPEEWYRKHVYEATFALYGPKEGEFVQSQMLDTLEQLFGK